MSPVHVLGAVIFLLAVSGGAVRAQAAENGGRTVYLTSLEWPPYTGKDLPQGGSVTALVRAALAAVGYTLRVEYYPWSRAVALARTPQFAGYFPEYTSPQVARDCLLSPPIGSSLLGFAETVDQPVRWRSLDDLAAYRIGVVQGYVNTDAFDRRVLERKQGVDVARDDVHNLMKLAAGRVSLAVIDKSVFAYLSQHDPRLRAIEHRLSFNERPLEEKLLYICFRPGKEGARINKLVKEGLKKIRLSKENQSGPR